MMRDVWFNLIVNFFFIEFQELIVKEYDILGNFIVFNFIFKCKLCEQKKGIEKVN